MFIPCFPKKIGIYMIQLMCVSSHLFVFPLQLLNLFQQNLLELYMLHENLLPEGMQGLD